MKATNVTRDVLEAAATEVGVALDLDAHNLKGNRWRVKVIPIVPADAYTPGGRRRRGERGNAPYQRISASYFQHGRRVHAVCWHGFRDFLRAVYRRKPDAVFVTMYTTYTGASNFEDTYQATGYLNIGPLVAPIAACEACTCPESGQV